MFPDSIASQLVKRSSDIDLSAYMTDGSKAGQPSGLQFTILLLTGVIGATFLGLLQYTFKLLLTLTVVEEPPAVYLPLGDDTEALGAAPKPHLVSHDNDRVFITSSIRGTLRHLRREAGFWSPFRGLGANIVFAFANTIARGFFISILELLLPLSVATIIGGIASMVVLSKLALVCTHIMISAPSSDSLWTRFNKTSWATTKKTIPAVVIWAAALQLVAELLVLAVAKDNTSSTRNSIIGIDVFLYILITIPATILLIRVQASVLSDDVATVVPFDKTFGQDTSDTDGVLTVKKAFKSIDREVFKRVCIFLLKSVPILMAATTLFVVAFIIMFFAWSK